MKDFFLVKNAGLMPLEGTMDAFTAGVFQNNVCLPQSLLFRWKQPIPCGQAALPLPPVKRLSGTAIFGGYLFAHFGHFLWESLSRLYAIRQCARLPLVFMSPNDSLATWQSQVFKLLHVHNPIVLIKQPTEVEQLVMSAPGATLPNEMHPDQINALGTALPCPPPLPTPSPKVWLSRSRFLAAGLGGGIDNETELEALLVARGWTILHPEHMPVQTQVRHLAAASHVAGFAGSAFHAALLARHVHGRMAIVSRGERISCTFPYLAHIKNFPLLQIESQVSHVSGEKATAIYHLNQPGQLAENLEQWSQNKEYPC